MACLPCSRWPAFPSHASSTVFALGWDDASVILKVIDNGGDDVSYDTAIQTYRCVVCFVRALLRLRHAASTTIEQTGNCRDAWLQPPVVARRHYHLHPTTVLQAAEGVARVGPPVDHGVAEDPRGGIGTVPYGYARVSSAWLWCLVPAWARCRRKSILATPAITLPPANLPTRCHASAACSTS